MNQLRFVIVLEFGSQQVDVRLEIIRGNVSIKTPHAFKDCITRENSRRPFGKQFEKTVFTSSQTDRASRALHVASRRVDGQVADLITDGLGNRTTPRHGSNTSQKHIE